MRKLGSALLVLAATSLAPEMVSAQAVITNGVVRLGINATGELNYAGVGVASVATGNDATFPGCTCEGWGVGLVGGTFNGVQGSFNTAAGNTGSTSLVSFGSTASTATSVVDIYSGSTAVMRVTHAYSPSATAALYQVNVTIANLTGDVLGSGATGLRYRRVMDWDIEPTPFQEFVMIDGGAAAANVLFTSNDGFASANPLSGSTNLGFTGDFAFQGPSDHGALFDFGFASLAAGESFSFRTFYGVAPTIASMGAALVAEDVEVYSMAYCNPAATATCTHSGLPNTFAFGFEGVGGIVIDPPGVVPEPMTMTLLGTGLVGVAVARRRRKAAQQN